MIPPMRSLPYEERPSRTGLWTLEDRLDRADLIDVYKIIHGVSSVSFDTFLKFSHNSITRGHSLKLQKGEFVLIYANTSLQRVINLWNSLQFL